MALLYKTVNPTRGVWKIEESVEEALARLSDKAAYAEFLARFTAEGRKREYLATRLLLRELLGEEASIAYRPSGAPFLPKHPLLYISISHTKGYAAVSLDNRPTGIDIEYRSDRVRKIRDRFLSAEEETHINPAHETAHLLIHWCAKETLFKLIDQEEVDFRIHLRVLPFPYSTEGKLTVREYRTPARREYTLAYHVTPEYVLTWRI